MKTIAITMDKGGVGKTTIAYNLAFGLARQGQRVLVMDTDPQGTLSKNLSKGSMQGRGVADLIAPDPDQPPPEPVVVRENLDLLPATPKLRDVEFLKDADLFWRLRDAKAHYEGKYDYCLMDSRPSLGPLTLIMLVAADKVLIPLEADTLSTQELPPLLHTIKVVQTRYGNEDLGILGLVLCRVDVRTSLARDARELLKQGFGDKVFDTWIPTYARIRECIGHGKDIFEYDQDDKGPGASATVFQNFINEFLRRSAA